MNLKEHHEHKEHTFDAFCKRVLVNEARDYFDAKKYRAEHETSLSYLSLKNQQQLSVMDVSIASHTEYEVAGNKVFVQHEYLSDLLDKLSGQKRQIILLYYFFNMNDKEIAATLNMARSTVQYQRNTALVQLKEWAGGLHETEY